MLKNIAESIHIYNLKEVRGNLTLPTKGENGSTIHWASENPHVITTSGEVTRPAHGEGDMMINLVATITLNDKTINKEFKAHVKEMPKEEAYKGYLFSYFIGEGYENGEQIYFSLSEGNDPLHWKEINDGNLVFSSKFGERGLRDPFLIRSPEGDKFYLIATDLRIYGNDDWEVAQINGSRSIMVWESNNLVDWSEQRMVEVSPPEAGNTWAPEVFYDQTTGEYVVFWASKIYNNVGERDGDATHQRMMFAKTRDFYTFTEPETYMDVGYSIIDTTMIEHKGKIYRFTKDERERTNDTPNGKLVFQEVGHSILDPHFNLIKEGIVKEQISQGEGPIIFKSNTEERWYMFIDEFDGRGYVPFETTDLHSGKWIMSANYKLPSRPRHGTVLPITKTEYEALLSNIPVEVANMKG